MRTDTPLLEACVESFEEALAAQNCGAGRIELCSRLDLDGITPSTQLITECVNGLDIPVKVMIRPHGGSFRYSEEELEEIEGSISKARKLGAFGVVFGFLNSDNSIDLPTTMRVVKFSYGLDITFHKAIDNTPDPIEAVRRLGSLDTHITVLSSGGAATAMDGKDNLKAMMVAGGDRITILPAGKITNHNWTQLHKDLGATAYHGRRIVN